MSQTGNLHRVKGRSHFFDLHILFLTPYFYPGHLKEEKEKIEEWDWSRKKDKAETAGG